MKYRIDQKSGNKLSLLGYGCMRFPRTLGQIDYKKSEHLVLEAVNMGVNYFDTAYMYLGSEEVLGEIVERNNLRDKIFIATKLPFAKCKTYDDFDIIFNKELDNLKTDYIDYYLIHNIGDIIQWEKLVNLGIERWISEKKISGKINQIGFSFHGLKDMFPKLLDAYDWDFCQIQYNYLNINYQAGRDGLIYANKKGLPVIIMEPLLGGKLASNLPKEVEKKFLSLDDDCSPAGHALKWIYNHEEVTVVLSGMNEEYQLIDNVNITDFCEPNMLTKSDLNIYDDIISIFNRLYKVNCTGCNYCMPCPHSVNIPGCFSAYNYYHVIGKISGLIHYVHSTKILTDDVSYLASNCLGCGICEKKCPQNIKISNEMKKVSKTMEPKALIMAINVFKKYRNKGDKNE